MSSTTQKYWNEECSFPQFQLLFRGEIEEPPAWFIELLLVAFIDDWESVTEFERIMSEWRLDSGVNLKNRLTALFSKNSAAFSYLSMGFNFMCNQRGDLGSEFLIDVAPACVSDFEAQQSDYKELTLLDFLSRKIHVGATLKTSYVLCLRALSLFRKDRTEQCRVFTEENVLSFLTAVFTNKRNGPVRNSLTIKQFFKSIESYENPDPEPSKDQAFIERAFGVIRKLMGFSDNLITFNGFVHDIPLFVDFAKKCESAMMTKVGV